MTLKVDLLPLKANIVVFAAVLGGFLFGYDTGVMSGTLVKLGSDRDDWNLDNAKKELIVSAAIWSAAAGALISGPLNNYFGRKLVMMSGAAILTVASAIMASAPSWQWLVVGRALDGIAIGFVSMTGPVYIAEQLPNDWRGPMTVCNQLMITVGILVGCVIAGLFANTDQGWRWMLGLSCFPSTLMFIMFIFLPKSARWLSMRGEEEQAREVLVQLRGTDDVTEELQGMQDDHRRTLEDQSIGGSGLTLFKNIVQSVAVRRAMVLGIMLQLVQQLSGINSVMYYSATIIVMSGASTIEFAIWIAAVVSLVNVLFTFVGLFSVERLGRKPLLAGSLVVMVVGLCLLAVAFLLMHPEDVAISGAEIGGQECNIGAGNLADVNCKVCIDIVGCKVCTGHSGSLLCVNGNNTKQLIDSVCKAAPSEYCPSDKAWLAIVGLVVYIAGFAPGMGPLPWTVNSEIFPGWARDTAISVTTFTNWICNSIISQTFLQLSTAATPSGAFFTYAAIALLGLVYFMFFLPETKNLSLETTNQLFSDRVTFFGFKAQPQRAKLTESQ